MSSSSLPLRKAQSVHEQPRVVSIPLPVSNAYLIQGERSVLVDAGVSGNGKAILKKLQQNPTTLFPGHGGPFDPAVVRRKFAGEIDFGEAN